MFEALTEKFTDVFRKMSGRGRITEQNIKDAMREVRTALLEADGWRWEHIHGGAAERAG